MVTLLAPLLAVGLAAQAASAPPDPRDRPTREQRLPAQKSALEAEIRKIDAFGRVDEFRGALEALQKKYAAVESETEIWAPCSDGWLPLMAIDHWLQWHGPAEGRTLPAALDFELANHPFATIADLARQLHEHDVEFLLVVFPSRLQLHPELVLPEIGALEAGSFRGMVGATTRFLLALNEKGVETLDLAPVFAEARAADPAQGTKRSEGINAGLYLARNKHWTPRAAELAAKSVAERLKATAWFTEGPSREGTDFSLFTRVKSVGGIAGGQSPDHTPEQVEVRQVRQLGKPVSPVAVRASPIVLLGDSFAKFYSEPGASSSFIDHLRRFTGWPIDAIAPMGGGEFQCRDQLSRRSDKLRGKKVVIWLLQEENLRPVPAFRAIDLFAE